MTSSQLAALSAQLQNLLSEKNKLQTLYQSSQIQRRQLRTIVNNHSYQDKESRELRATLADRNFELRKLTQDIATEKTMLELQKIKLQKGYEGRIQELKDKIQNDNKDWIRRFDLQSEEFKEEVRKVKQQYEENSKKEIVMFKEKSDIKIEEINKESSEVVEKLKIEIVKIEKTHRQEKERIVKQYKDKLDRQLKATNERLATELNRKQKQYDLKFRMIENEKKYEETQHEQTRKQFVSAKDNLYEQIYKLKTEREDLEEKVKDLEIETQEKTKKILALNESIRELEIKHSEQINALSESSKRTLDSLKNKSTGDIEQVLRTQMIYVNTIEAKVKVLEDKQKDMIDQHKSQIDQITQCFNDRPSKSQDVDEIKILRQKLWKKEKQLQFVQEQVKWYKLELDNKEEVYTKIFTNGYTTQELKTPSDKYLNMQISPANRELKSRRVGKSLILKKKPDDARDYTSALLHIQKNLI